MRGFVFVSSLALLTGCFAVGPDYEPPQIETPASFAEGSMESIHPEDIASWWECFSDPQLNGLVQGVLEANLDLASAVQRVESARAVYGISAADRLPTFAATGSYSRTRPLVGTQTQHQYTVGGTVSWEIDLFGRVRRSVESSLASFEAQIEDLRGVQVALVAEVVANYLALLSLQERLDIAARNVDGQEKSQDIADRRHEAGMAAGLDPAQARVNLHSTQAVVPLLELERRRAFHRLAVLSGLEPRALLDQLALKGELPSIPQELLVGVPADLLKNRPDLRSLERRLASQTARVGAAIATLYPSIQLIGSWDWLAEEPSELFDGDTDFGGVGPQINLPLFNAGRLRSQVDAEEAALQELHRQYQQQILVAQEEVENAMFALVRDRRQVSLLIEASNAASESVDLSRQLYTSGQSDFQNVLDAQRSLFGLEDDLARAKLNTMLDVVDIYRSIGGGWGAPGPVLETEP